MQNQDATEYSIGNRVFFSIGRFCIAFVLLLLPQFAFSQLAPKELRDLWKRGEYSKVVQEARIIRQKPFGRNLEVDYMIATSLCRLPGNSALAAKWFAWVMEKYQIPYATKQIINNERRTCSEANSQVIINISAGGVKSTSGVRGKTFFLFNITDEAMVSSPVKQVYEISEAELESRLISLFNNETALKLFNKSLVNSNIRGERIINLGSYAFNEQYTTYKTSHFLFVGDHTQNGTTFERIGNDLEDYLDFYRSEFNMLMPEQFITVYVASDASQLHRISEAQHGITLAESTIGYSFQNDLSITAIVPYSGQGTLKHELFHLLARGNFGDIPPWLDEGIAALYEVSQRDKSTIKGMPNWRGRVLYTFGENPIDTTARWNNYNTYLRSVPPITLSLSQLIDMHWDQFDKYAEKVSNNEIVDYMDTKSQIEQAYHHAMARYFALYLQELNYLPCVYSAFQKRGPEQSTSNTSEAILTRAFGQPLVDIQSSFNKWLFKEVMLQQANEWRDK